MPAPRITKPFAGRAVAGPLRFVDDADPARFPNVFVRDRFHLANIAPAVAEVRHLPGVSQFDRHHGTFAVAERPPTALRVSGESSLYGSDVPYDPAVGKGKKGRSKRAPGPSSDDPHALAFFKRHVLDDPNQSTPGYEFLSARPVNVEATMYAVLKAANGHATRRLRAPIALLEWLRGNNIGLRQLRQAEVDQWLLTGPPTLAEKSSTSSAGPLPAS